MSNIRKGQKKKRSLGVLLLGIFFVLICGLVVILLNQIQKNVQETFGKPSGNLSYEQEIIYSVRLFINEEALTNPVSKAGQQVDFHIDSGESAAKVASSLQTSGLISNTDALIIYLKYSGLDTQLQAGDYTLNTGQSAIELANKLRDATPEKVAFRILAGWRAEEVAAALPTSGLSIKSADFTQAVRHPDAALLAMLNSKDIQNLEGFLYPDSYQFKRTITLNEMLTTILSDFNIKVSADIRQGFTDQGLTLLQGVTLASIVEKEAVVQDEQTTIASVFLNRLKSGMPLESDPTVQYALGYNSDQATWWTNPLSAADLKVDSPYNTYVYTGLPPAPISNPSLAALKAVAFPETTDYYYFRAACDGSGRHKFAQTYQEQLQNACP